MVIFSGRNLRAIKASIILKCFHPSCGERSLAGVESGSNQSLDWTVGQARTCAGLGHASPPSGQERAHRRGVDPSNPNANARIHEAEASGLSTASRYSRTVHMMVSMSTRDGMKRGHLCGSLAPPLSSTRAVWIPKQPNERTNNGKPLLPVHRTEASTYQDIYLWSQNCNGGSENVPLSPNALGCLVTRSFGKVPKATGHLIVTIKSSRNGRSIHK